MKNIEPTNDFDRQLNTSDVSTSELLQDELTEQQKAEAWQEFEAEQRSLDYENNFYNTYK